jgi:hypothetical protein
VRATHRALLGAGAALAAVLSGACDRKGGPSVADTTIAPAPAPPAIPLSRFNVPLEYDFTTVLGVVERAVPKKFGSIDSVRQVGDDSRRHYAFEAVRDPFTAYAEGELLHLRATLSYRVRGYYKPMIGPTLQAGCGNGDNQPRLQVELVTPLSLTSDWHLASRAQILRVSPASERDEDRCKVSVLRKDVTDGVIQAARRALIGHLRQIDQKVGAVDLTRRFTSWWSLLNRPIRIAEGVWLMLGPEQLRLGSVVGTGRVLTVQVGLDARPRIVTGARPEVDSASLTLPPLARDTVVDGFHVLLDGIVDYPTASRAMTDALRGKVVAEHGRSVTVESVAVSPAPGGRLALAVSFSGDAQGTLRFVGIPRFDQRRREVTVPDLDYDLRTDDPLLRTYSWLRSDDLRSYFRRKARVPETIVLDRARSLLLRGLNRRVGEVMTLSATVDSVAVQGLYVTPAALIARAQASGHAAVAVRQSSGSP